MGILLNPAGRADYNNRLETCYGCLPRWLSQYRARPTTGRGSTQRVVFAGSCRDLRPIPPARFARPPTPPRLAHPRTGTRPRNSTLNTNTTRRNYQQSVRRIPSPPRRRTALPPWRTERSQATDTGRPRGRLRRGTRNRYGCGFQGWTSRISSSTMPPPRNRPGR